jgi:hypothetical protein
MAGLLPVLFQLRAIAGLLLAVVALQATPVRPLPVVPDRGPAFSAASAEVAVVARRAQFAGVRPEVQPEPLPPPPPPLPQAYNVARAPVTVAGHAPSGLSDTPFRLALDVRPATPVRGPPAA